MSIPCWIIGKNLFSIFSPAFIPTKELKEEIADLKENNQNIIAQNNALLARLERLEKVALGDLKSKDLAVYQLK